MAKYERNQMSLDICIIGENKVHYSITAPIVGKMNRQRTVDNHALTMPITNPTDADIYLTVKKALETRKDAAFSPNEISNLIEGCTTIRRVEPRTPRRRDFLYR
ncbi:TPA: hypothetical protein HA278_03095 [Candidatus Woesearchaeota archaeon]|nr:hypothetical protein [archaeon]HIJ11021.1 hypothetical protein [Candidatus Woesearchaeota archaeon]